ncbi:hypothetical protein [Demequina sp. NBRC 110057]|uniref:hypothetical protein n=1 Tax=Demequina sp. NBRC 110057 TaxID=1570346 RepID=UPI0009FCCBD5|nr:hypothetical protein [Demequina sp. NBRC 110057]
MSAAQGGAGEDDATRLSARRTPIDQTPDAAEDDATRLASRRAPQADAAAHEDEATRLASRRLPEADAAAHEDEATRLASRRPQAAHAPEVPDTSDDTTTRHSAAPVRAKRRAVLPPGLPPGEVTSAGAFGEAGDTYGPRATPIVRAPRPAEASAASSDTASRVLSPAEVAARHAQRRRRRLIVGVVVAAVGAAALTALVVLIVTALESGA